MPRNIPGGDPRVVVGVWIGIGVYVEDSLVSPQAYVALTNSLFVAYT